MTIVSCSCFLSIANMYTYEACKKVANNIVDIPNTYGKLYEDFIVSNASSIGSIESGLRSLTYIIPGRFRDAEIASESCMIIDMTRSLSRYSSNTFDRSALLCTANFIIS